MIESSVKSTLSLRLISLSKTMLLAGCRPTGTQHRLFLNKINQKMNMLSKGCIFGGQLRSVFNSFFDHFFLENDLPTLEHNWQMEESKKRKMRAWWFRFVIVMCDYIKSHIHYAMLMAKLNGFKPNVNFWGETSNSLGLSCTADLKDVWRSWLQRLKYSPFPRFICCNRGVLPGEGRLQDVFAPQPWRKLV